MTLIYIDVRGSLEVVVFNWTEFYQQNFKLVNDLVLCLMKAH